MEHRGGDDVTLHFAHTPPPEHRLYEEFAEAFTAYPVMSCPILIGFILVREQFVNQSIILGFSEPLEEWLFDQVAG